jgi:hypothetical protein
MIETPIILINVLVPHKTFKFMCTNLQEKRSASDVCINEGWREGGREGRREEGSIHRKDYGHHYTVPLKLEPNSVVHIQYSLFFCEFGPLFGVPSA